ncbi:MAG: SurA N-terminal domain-containing protein [Abditibacteriota bacterium]|nr:SurA N-terminal domain-containing protein [Abditibacteriota bacterium]
MGIYRLRTDFATHLRVILWVILVIFVIGSLYMFGARPRSMQGGNAKDVVITVQNDEIRRSEFDAEWERYYEMASAGGVKSPLQYANIKGLIVSNIINYQKDIQIAENKGIRISKKELKAAIDEKIAEDLKVNRAAIMGDIPKSEEKLDPRKDKKYLKVLSDNGMSIDSLVQTTKESVSELSVKAELARNALVAQAQKKADDMTDKELEDTWKNYHADVMIITDNDSTEEKAMEAAKKAAEELRKGKNIGDVSKNTAGSFALPETVYNEIDSPYLPQEAAKLLEGLKEGEVADPVKTDAGIYIVKLNKTEKTLPGKLTDKVKKDRRKAYKEVLKQQAEQSIRSEEEKIEGFEVKDPELAGYYYAFRAAMEYAPDKKKAFDTKAAKNLEAASKNDTQGNKDMILAALASVKFDMEEYDDCAGLLHKILDDPDSQITESYDLRLLYGDALVKQNKKEEAGKQYKQASDLNRSDAYVHEELADKFKQIGMSAEAAEESKKAADIRAFEEKRMKEYEDLQKAAPKKEEKKDKKDSDKKK